MLGEFAESMAMQAHQKNIEVILDILHIEQSTRRGNTGRISQIITALIPELLIEPLIQDGSLLRVLPQYLIKLKNHTNNQILRLILIENIYLQTLVLLLFSFFST